MAEGPDRVGAIDQRDEERIGCLIRTRIHQTPAFIVGRIFKRIIGLTQRLAIDVAL